MEKRCYVVLKPFEAFSTGEIFARDWSDQPDILERLLAKNAIREATQEDISAYYHSRNIAWPKTKGTPSGARAKAKRVLDV